MIFGGGAQSKSVMVGVKQGRRQLFAALLSLVLDGFE